MRVQLLRYLADDLSLQFPITAPDRVISIPDSMTRNLELDVHRITAGSSQP
jgi:hypothetical protein